MLAENHHLPDNILVITLKGKIEQDEIERLTHKAEDKLAAFEHVGVFVDATHMDGISAKALARDITWEIQHIGEWKRFAKLALVAEDGVLSQVARAMGALMPQIEVRAFSTAERDAALGFVSSVPVTPAAH